MEESNRYLLLKRNNDVVRIDGIGTGLQLQITISRDANVVQVKMSRVKTAIVIGKGAGSTAGHGGVRRHRKADLATGILGDNERTRILRIVRTTGPAGEFGADIGVGAEANKFSDEEGAWPITRQGAAIVRV